MCHELAAYMHGLNCRFCISNRIESLPENSTTDSGSNVFLVIDGWAINGVGVWAYFSRLIELTDGPVEGRRRMHIDAQRRTLGDMEKWDEVLYSRDRKSVV